jgi:hypothetical protein
MDERLPAEQLDQLHPGGNRAAAIRLSRQHHSQVFGTHAEDHRSSRAVGWGPGGPQLQWKLEVRPKGSEQWGCSSDKLAFK